MANWLFASANRKVSVEMPLFINGEMVKLEEEKRKHKKQHRVILALNII